MLPGAQLPHAHAHAQEQEQTHTFGTLSRLGNTSDIRLQSRDRADHVPLAGTRVWRRFGCVPRRKSDHRSLANTPA